MSRRRIRVILDAEDINYAKLEKGLSQSLSGPQKVGVSVLFRGLRAMSPSNADKAVVAGADLFQSAILNLLNQAASDYGVRFSDISITE